MIAEVFGGLAEDRAEIGLLHRRVGIFARPRRLERVPAGLNPALDVARLAAHADKLLEPVVMGLELVISDAPILDRQFRPAGVEKLLAVALQKVRAINKVRDLRAEALAVPVHE